jgi:hypothetical protein
MRVRMHLVEYTILPSLRLPKTLHMRLGLSYLIISVSSPQISSEHTRITKVHPSIRGPNDAKEMVSRDLLVNKMSTEILDILTNNLSMCCMGHSVVNKYP